MVLASGFLFPVADLPAPFGTIAQSLPMFHAVETFRLLSVGREHVSVPWVWACPFILAAWAVVLAVVGGVAFHRRMLSER